MAKKKACRTPQRVWEDISLHLVHFVEGLFFNLGAFVARHPWKTIIITWLFVFTSCIGLTKFRIEKNPLKLWVPPESDFLIDTNWFIENFGSGFRMQKVLITADNVLEPRVLAFISKLTTDVNSIKVTYNFTEYSIKDLCFQVPVINSEKFLADVVGWVNYDFYCQFVENFPYMCLQENIADVWNNKFDVIGNLTKQDIIGNLSTITENPETGLPIDYKKFLGDIKHNENGTIVSAGSVLLTWYTKVNMTEINLNEVGNLVGTEEFVSLPLATWEKAFLEMMEILSHNLSDINVYYEAGRSFGDVSGEAMFNELDKLFMGIFLMFFYIQFALSRCNWLEVKLTLGGVGLMCVGMAYITAVSWCSGLGVSFGPVHSSLPFLLMGLGVDDMFVMKACWEQLTPEEMQKSLPHKVGLMLKHAGVSIVITSFTDIVALLIGAITILPSLKSFCIYAAAGVFFIFCYSVTYYVAVFTLDLRRIEANRNGILFCYKHKTPVQISSKQSTFQIIFSEFYKKIVFTTPVKTMVIIFTIVMTGFSIDGILKLEQRFDPRWFIPDGTYYKEFLTQHELFYPNEGNMAMVFLGEMDYNKEFASLYEMSQELGRKSFVKNFNPWVDSFQNYVLKNYERDLRNVSAVSDEEFKTYLSRFLFSPVGGQYQINLKFTEPIKCGSPVTNITASSMLFNFPRFEGPKEYLPVMNHVKEIVKSSHIETGDGYRSVWSKVFANWVTDEVIGVEVERNIELALLCVMLCTVVLITNLQMCFWIFLCVLLTIVNVLGWMQRWGMTVDIVCCIGLELAIGLCVDYAAHVGHTFLTISEGSRSERALKTVTSIGTAVLLGGGSTFLSLSLLSMSKAYTFQSFFKIFFLVIIFGLFNGLIFLPTVLSLIGPSAYMPKLEHENSPYEIEELNAKKQIEEESKSQKKDCDDNLL